MIQASAQVTRPVAAPRARRARELAAAPPNRPRGTPVSLMTRYRQFL